MHLVNTSWLAQHALSQQATGAASAPKPPGHLPVRASVSPKPVAATTQITAQLSGDSVAAPVAEVLGKATLTLTAAAVLLPRLLLALVRATGAAPRL